MLSFHDAASVAASPSAVSDPRLQQLLSEAVHHWGAMGLLEMTYLIIVEPGDTAEAVEEELGFSLLAERPDQQLAAPIWDDLRDRGGFHEMTITVGNSGWAFVLFVMDAEGVDPALLALCRGGGQAPCTGF